MTKIEIKHAVNSPVGGLIATIKKLNEVIDYLNASMRIFEDRERDKIAKEVASGEE